MDNPHANKLTIHILAAVAQHEREIISARTSSALKAAKARGLGNRNSHKLGDAPRWPLVELGMEPTKAMATVRAARPGAIETSDQEKFLLHLGVMRK